MKNIITIIILSSLFVGCAGIKVYSDKDLQHESGIKIYNPKPFLLVETNPSKDIPMKTTVVYLPDMEHPVYVKKSASIGSTDFAFTTNENGTIATFGIKTDSKIPETITSIGGLVTNVGSLLTSIATAKATTITTGEEKTTVKPTFQLYEIVFTADKTQMTLREVKILN